MGKKKTTVPTKQQHIAHIQLHKPSGYAAPPNSINIYKLLALQE